MLLFCCVPMQRPIQVPIDPSAFSSFSVLSRNRTSAINQRRMFNLLKIPSFSRIYSSRLLSVSTSHKFPPPPPHARTHTHHPFFLSIRYLERGEDNSHAVLSAVPPPAPSLDRLVGCGGHRFGEPALGPSSAGPVWVVSQLYNTIFYLFVGLHVAQCDRPSTRF